MTQGSGKRTRSRHCLTGETEEIDCGFTWASWEETWPTVKDELAECDAEGNTPRFSKNCLFINETFETLNNSSAPTLTNCADDVDERSRPIVFSSGQGCAYLTERVEKEIDGKVMGYQSGFKQNSWLKFDLFLKSGQTGIKDVLNIECPSCRSETNHMKIQARNINTTHYDLEFGFRNKKTQTNLFENGEMDDETSTSWQEHGATVTYQASSYSNGGYLITGRTETFHGIKYEFTQSDVVNMRNRNSFFMQFFLSDY